MASTDARPIPLKNTAYRVTFPILDADGDLVTGASGLDSEVSIDGGTFGDCTNEATEIATSSGMYYLDLTSGEMNGDTIAIIVKTSTTGAKTTPIVLYPQEADDIKVSVTHWTGTAVASPDTAGYPKVTVKSGTGTGELSLSSGVVAADAVKLSGDTTAADNAESFFDGTGYAGTNNVIPTVTTVTNAPGTVRTGTAQAGAAGTITLDAGASATNDLYNGAAIVITSGTGAGQCNGIIDYVGGTKVAHVAKKWATNPDNTSVFAIIPQGVLALLGISTEQLNEADMPEHSLYTATAHVGGHKVEDDGAGNLNIYQSDGTTVHATQAIVDDGSALPITGVGAAS